MSSTSFRNTISGVSITGVTTQLDHEPIGKHVPDCPFSFPTLPKVERLKPTSSTCPGDQTNRTCELIVALNPIGQDNREPNWEATLAMEDNVETALNTLYTTGNYLFTYTIEGDEYQVGEMIHWAVIASLNLIE